MLRPADLPHSPFRIWSVKKYQSRQQVSTALWSQQPPPIEYVTAKGSMTTCDCRCWSAADIQLTFWLSDSGFLTSNVDTLIHRLRLKSPIRQVSYLFIQLPWEFWWALYKRWANRNYNENEHIRKHWIINTFLHKWQNTTSTNTEYYFGGQSLTKVTWYEP